MANEAKIHQGAPGEWRDTPLSNKGEEQAKQLAERLKEESYEIIYCSSLQRVRKTAEAINIFHHLPIVFDERIREGEDKETSKEFVERVKSFLDELKTKPEKRVLVVTHGGVVTTALALTTGSREKGTRIARRFGKILTNTSVSILENEGEHYKIKLIGCVKHRGQEALLRKNFKIVQTIPYKVIPFDKEALHEFMDHGDCRHKSELLLRLLKKDGFKVKKVIVIFDWKDLPLPKDVLSPLVSGTKMAHELVAVEIDGEYIYLDATWNHELEPLGFPVTGSDWDSQSDTLQVTKGKLEYFFEEDFDKNKADINKNKKELHAFAERLNAFLNDAYVRFWDAKKKESLEKKQLLRI